MTVNTKKITSGPYAGNGIADTFSYGFKVNDKTELNVYETDESGVQIQLVVDTDYTVNTVGNGSGGTITRTAGPLPTGYEWYIRSNYDETQLTAFQSQGAFFPELHEQAMDKLTFLIQQILDTQSRTPTLSSSYSGPLGITLPNPEDAYFIRWRSDSTGFDNVFIDVEGLNQSIVDANEATANANEAIEDLNEAIEGISGNPVGDYQSDPTLLTLTDYTTFQGFTYKVKTTAPLPHKVDSTLYPDPTDDSALVIYSDVNSTTLARDDAASKIGSSSGESVQYEIDDVKSNVTSNTLRITTNESAISSLTENQQSGVIVFQTYALLDAYTPNVSEQKGSFKVVNDPNSSLNGYYSWVSGTVYVKDADLVVNEINESNTSDAVSGKAVFDFKSESYEKELNTIANGEYTDLFKYFNISEQIAVNLSDAVTPNYTSTRVAGGLNISLSTGSRNFVFSTSVQTGNNITRIKYSATIATGTSSVGVAFSDGVDFYFANASAIGRFSDNKTGILSQSLPTYTTGSVIEIECVINAKTNTLYMYVSVDGSAPFAFGISDVPLGEFWLFRNGTGSVVNDVKVSAISELQGDYNCLPTSINSSINGLTGLLDSLEVSRPNGFVSELPIDYKMYMLASNYFSSIDLQPILSPCDPEVLTLYVDVLAGSNTSSGTDTDPLKSINVALLRGGLGSKLIVRVKGGIYPFEDSWRGSSSSSSVLQVESWDGVPVISSMHDDSLFFAVHSGTTYVATFADSVVNVFDAANLTSDGDYGALESVGDIADCIATPNTFFISGADIYVHLHDGRLPDSFLRVYKSSTFTTNNGNSTKNGTKTYLENIHFEGGRDGAFGTRYTDPLQKQYLYAKDCTFKYSGADATDIDGWVECISQRCVAAWSGDDGFNYHARFGSPPCQAIEIDCIGRWNGRDNEGTNNGSTMHEGGVAIRINGSYHHNQDRNIHDIGGGFTWMLNCDSRDSQTANANYTAGIGGSETDQMWLDSCTSSGSGSDIEANGVNTIVYTFNFSGDSSNIGNGTVTTYTP